MAESWVRQRSNTWNFARFWMWAAVRDERDAFVRVSIGTSDDWRRPGTVRSVFVGVGSWSRAGVAAAVRRGMCILREDAKRGD